MIIIDYKQLSDYNIDLCLDIADRAMTVQECWEELDSLLDRDRITTTTYNEIKANATFEIDET